MNTTLLYWDRSNLTADEAYSVMRGNVLPLHTYLTVFEGEIDAATPEAACEALFEKFNIGDFGGKQVRSMSVGDIVQVAGKAFVCAPAGWQVIP